MTSADDFRLTGQFLRLQCRQNGALLEAFRFQAVCACICDHMLKDSFVNVISYKPLVGISPDLQLWCSWAQR